MSEMVERVARAICMARRWSPENWDLAESEARAAIKAMRDDVPKAARLYAALTIAHRWSVPNDRASDVAVDAWEAIIDEARK